VYPGKRRPQILDMTLSQLVNDMRSRGNRYGSSASGRYQYIRKTLQGVAGSMGLDMDNTKFDEKTQDAIAIYHLRRSHGLDKWLAGRMSDKDFLNKLAGTWAGIPKSTGGSAYAGVLDNKAGMSANAALGSLDQIKRTA
jgi:muramidase (phage lysozyme)